MGMLAWTMMGLALWHFTIWLPDHFWGGIVGAFLGALFGGIIFGFAINGGHGPRRGRHAPADRAGGGPRRDPRHGRGLPRGHAARVPRVVLEGRESFSPRPPAPMGVE